MTSDFDRREDERRQGKIARFDGIAAERARLLDKNRYYAAQLERLVSSLVLPGQRVLEVGCGLGDLLVALKPRRGVGVDISPAMIQGARERHASGSATDGGKSKVSFRVVDVERDPLPEGPFDVVVLSDTLGMLDDIETVLRRLRGLLAPDGRLVVTYYNFLWEPALRMAELLQQKTRWPDQSWLSMTDIENLLYLSGLQVVRSGTDVLVPVDLPGVSVLANRVGAKIPIVRETALVQYFVARATPERMPAELPGVSVICPCKNEKGNIASAVARTPVMGSATELVFVDGNSTDGTYEEIEQIIRSYQGPLQLRLVSQGDGKGKGDAVRKGFAAAVHEVLMILDSDLTVPPEDLPKFFHALVSGKGEMINGVRLVYPMEGEAMRFLNLLGNKFFSVALSWVLEQPIKDSLCGTKVLFKKDYERIAHERGFFGDFDPFGDFDLLFGAARLNMKIVDLPVRYRARTYGDTKISRFSHGWLLLKMTAFGFRKLRMGM